MKAVRTGGPDAHALDDTMVVFDWNGAVVVDADRSRAALNAVLGRRALPQLGEADFSLRFRLPLTELLPRLGVAADDLDAASAEWSSELAETHARLREGAAECLATLSERGAWLGVVSAASAAAVRFDQRMLAVPSVWNSVDVSVADKLEVLAGHRPTRPLAYFVGVSADDLRCASAADYVAVGLTETPGDCAELRAAGAVHLIESLSELPGLLERESENAGFAQV